MLGSLTRTAVSCGLLLSFIAGFSSSFAQRSQGDHGLTNQISSALLLSDTATASAPLRIVRGHALAKSFTIYIDDANGNIDDNGRTLSGKILHWNGKVYR